MKQLYLKTLVLLLMCMVGGSAFAYDCVVDGIYYNLNKEEMTAEVTDNGTYNSYSGEVVIPSTITFSGPFSPTSNRTINDNGEITYSVTSIGNTAFYGCTGLTSVAIGNSVTTIGKQAFFKCSGLTSITIGNSVTTIGDGAFFECRGLTSITIPNSVTNIEDEAFENCSGLTSVIIPSSVTSIGYAAFRYCTGLTRVDYSSLEHLCSIEFETVESNPLFYARHLYINGEELKDNLILPENITSIGVGALNGCILKNVMLKHQTPPTVNTNTFSDPTRYHATLYVPAGTWESYAYDDGWYTFINIRETAMEEAQLSPTLSYTLMDARTFSYMVYDPVNNGIGTITSVGIDENNPNHSWQTLVVEGERYLYNIGARKFAVPSADGKSLELSDKAGSLSITDGQDGLLFDNQTDRQWALVVNEKMTVDSHAEEAVTSSVSSMRADSSKATSVCYGIDGRRQSASQCGLNIIRMSDGTVRKVVIK